MKAKKALTKAKTKVTKRKVVKTKLKNQDPPYIVVIEMKNDWRQLATERKSRIHGLNRFIGRLKSRLGL